jgi:hypothetical protein
MTHWLQLRFRQCFHTYTTFRYHPSMFNGIKDRIFCFFRQDNSADLSNRLPYVTVCKYDSLIVYKNKKFVYLDDYLRDRTLLGRTDTYTSFRYHPQRSTCLRQSGFGSYPDPNDIPTILQLHNSYMYYWCEG